MPKSKVLNKHVLAALVPGARVDNTTFEIAVETHPDAPTVIFNVGGVIFETYRSTLCRHTDTNLSDETFLEKFYRHSQNDYFFDHDPVCFSAVLEYLRTGELHLPPNVCGPALKRELDFWGVSEHLIQNCCWNAYDTWNNSFESLQQLERDRKRIFVEYEPADPEDLTTWQKCRRAIWNLLTNETSSVGAKIYGLTALLFVILSILTFVLETHSSFRVSGQRDLLGRLYRQSPNKTNITEMWIPHPALVIMDIICLVFFTLELLVRFVCSPSQRRFFLNFFNIVDFISLLPDYIEVIVFSQTDHDTVTSIIHYINFLRIMRVFRVFRLVRHVSGLWIMIYTLKASMRDLLLMCVFMMMGMLIFSSLIYYVEDEKFPNIPISLWWALITMTTVGYGDMYPESNLGYLIGSLCAMAGLLVVGFTVPIIVNHFVLYYTHIQSAMRAHKREQKMAKENKNLDLMIEEERRESIGSKQRWEIVEQLKKNAPICNGGLNGGIHVSTERRERRETSNHHQTHHKDIFKIDLPNLPPQYSSLDNLDEGSEPGKKCQCGKNSSSVFLTTKGMSHLRRTSLPSGIFMPSGQKYNTLKSPTVEDNVLSVECTSQTESVTNSEYSIEIDLEKIEAQKNEITIL